MMDFITVVMPPHALHFATLVELERGVFSIISLPDSQATPLGEWIRSCHQLSFLCTMPQPPFFRISSASTITSGHLFMLIFWQVFTL
jgi:hypothetical protein